MTRPLDSLPCSLTGDCVGDICPVYADCCQQCSGVRVYPRLVMEVYGDRTGELVDRLTLDNCTKGDVAHILSRDYGEGYEGVVVDPYTATVVADLHT